jgi:hypothetical protein
MPSVEERLTAIEPELARLKEAKRDSELSPTPWWEKMRGDFKDDPNYDQAMRLGRKWRESFRPKEDTAARR